MGSSINDSAAAIEEAPDKGVQDVPDYPEEQKQIPALDNSVEPVVVEYNPGNVVEREQPSFIDVEDERNLVDIHLRAKLEQPEQPEPEPQRPPAEKGGLFKSLVTGIKDFLGEAVGDNREKKFRTRNEIELASGSDYAEVYTEVTKKEGRKAHANVTWSLRNASTENSWTPKMQLVPVMSNPTLRIHFESSVAGLRPGGVEELKLKVRIPEEFNSNHLILFLKLKQGRRFVGPSMLLFVKIIRSESGDVEESSFAQDDLSDGSAPNDAS